MSEFVDKAAADVLSRKKVLLRHSGARMINELYPTPYQASTQLAEVNNSRGRLRITGNSLALGGQTNFTISSASILTNFSLHASILMPAARVPIAGWLLSAIDRLEITFSQSLLQSVQISGLAWREYLLYTCGDEVCRNKLIEQAGAPFPPNGGLYSASVPIGNLLSHALGTDSQYGIDSSTISGPIQLTITWNGVGSFSMNTGATIAPSVAAFTSLALTTDTHDLLTAPFSVRNMMSYDEDLSYNIPVRYLNSIRRTLAFDPGAGVEQILQLNSAPSGMLEAIILCIKPTGEFGTAAFVPQAGANSPYLAIGGSVNLSSLRLTFSGTDLFRADTASEIASNYRGCFGGDTLRYSMVGPEYDVAGPGPASATEHVLYDKSRVYCIPLGYDMCKVARGKLVENLPSYSGASLELRFTVDNQQQRIRRVKNEPFLDVAQTVVGSAAEVPFTVEVLYVISAILEITQGSVDLVL